MKRHVLDDNNDAAIFADFMLDAAVRVSLDKFKWERIDLDVEVALYDSDATDENHVQRVFGVCATVYPYHTQADIKHFLQQAQPTKDAPCKEVRFMTVTDKSESDYIEVDKYLVYVAELLY